MLKLFEIQKARPKDTPYKLTDGEGLHVLIRTNGKKLWRFRYHFDGKEKMMSLGSFPEVSLLEARGKRDEMRKLLSRGDDPSRKKKLDKIAAATAARNTFGAIAEEHLQNLQANGAAETTMIKNRWYLQKLAAPLTNLPITEITSAEILHLLKRIEKSGRPRMRDDAFDYAAPELLGQLWDMIGYHRWLGRHRAKAHETFSDVALSADPETARPAIAAAIDERGIYIRRLKSVVLPELPERTFNRIILPMPPDQRRLYDEVMSGLIRDVRTTDDAGFMRNLASFMSRRAALLQICSNPAAVTEGYSGHLPAKLMALDAILADLIEHKSEKVVLWSFFTISLDAMWHRYRRYNPVRIDGSVSAVADRREAVRRFQQDNSTMLFIGNPAAAGAGLTLHRARYAIYESMSNQAAHYLQSLDRIHRRGQRRPVEYLILLCDETIELLEYDRLLNKEVSAQQLLGDKITPPITREAFLHEMLGVTGSL